MCEEGESEAKRAANKSYITQNNSIFMALAKMLKIKHFNVDVGSARRANRECQKFIMLNENGLFKMLEFDIAIFLFAIFQLCLTNLIVFKLVSINNQLFTDLDNCLYCGHRTSSIWIPT